jgi:hypothetical protein
MEGRSDRVEDPLNLADMIKSVTRAYESRTRSTIHDLHQPRGTPAIQLSPSPELEPLPTFSSVLSADGDRDPDSMDWEPTEPAASDPALHPNALHSHSSGASSVWDRFATAKQRIFARGQLTGLERAFESWKDLGTSLNINREDISSAEEDVKANVIHACVRPPGPVACHNLTGVIRRREYAGRFHLVSNSGISVGSRMCCSSADTTEEMEFTGMWVGSPCKQTLVLETHSAGLPSYRTVYLTYHANIPRLSVPGR